MSVLYVRVPDALSDELKAISAESGISMSKMVEAVLAHRLGHDHSLESSIRNAIRLYRAGKAISEAETGRKVR